MPIPVPVLVCTMGRTTWVTGHQATPEELAVLNAYRRSPAGREEKKQREIRMWREKFNEARAKLKKLGEEV